MPRGQHLRALSLLLFLVVSSISAADTSASNTTTRVPLPAYLRQPSNTSVCQPISINYISPGLPQQCLPSRHGQPVTSSSSSANASEETSAFTLATSTVTFQNTTTAQDSARLSAIISTTQLSIAKHPQPTSVFPTDGRQASSKAIEPDTEDSPLDTAKFLSFEEWKNQNLAKVGQSADSFGARGVREPRKIPGTGNAALDSLGEDMEIDIGGDSTGSAEEVVQVSASMLQTGSGEATAAGAGVIPRSHEAGKTCKERFNYASFDCAATVHKTNKEAKSWNSILVENKETYMLNKCSAKEKFFIVELCEDILVDTVVLANFEFFSSVFKELRVSVSDRYPVKANGWKVLGTFVAKNTRNVQAFLIQNPLIWARYMKIDILSHYGQEYYCPVSLFRVHGTTMMEEFRHQEEVARGETVEDVMEEMVPEAVADPIKPVENATQKDLGPKTTMEEVQKPIPTASSVKAQAAEPSPSKSVAGICVDSCLNSYLILQRSPPACPLNPLLSSPTLATPNTRVIEHSASSHQQPGPMPPAEADATAPLPSESPHSSSISSTSTNQIRSSSASATKQTESRIAEVRASTSQQAAPPNPTTQESFFKSVHKRLMHLEGNATLSLQYIEEQSRILRDAFAKMERKQIAKVEQLLEKLHSTAFADLRDYREKYDQLWQSTVIALESQRSYTEHEMHALSARLSLLADEVIFQKRLYQLNTILLLITIGVVIFSRNDRLVVPLSQHLRTRSSARIFESPPNSPPPRLAMLRRDSSDSLAPNSPVEYGMPGGSSAVTINAETGVVSGGHLPPKYSREISPVMESKSSPPTPHGVRGVSGKSWIPFGPQLRVEGQGRRWQRLPSPLGSSTDVRPADVDEDEEALVDGNGDADVINGEPGGEVYHDQNGET